jgi:hypothetical protein
MLQEVTPLFTPGGGVVKIDSMQRLRLYLKDLMSYYEKECDKYGEKVGLLMRFLEKDMRGKNPEQLRDIEWRKVGMVMVHNKEPSRGTLEIMIEAMEDFKAKATRTREVLANIEELEALGIPDNAAILVYLRHGVPLRIVIDGQRTPEVDALLASQP